MAGTFSHLVYHIVFSTRHRRPIITEKIEKAIYKYMAGIIHGEEGIVLAINGTVNHVHMVCILKPRHYLPDILRLVKSNTSGWINDGLKTQGRFYWQRGYGVFTLSYSLMDKAIRYVDLQKEHHRKLSFEEEYVRLLKMHNVSYDPKYLWD